MLIYQAFIFYNQNIGAFTCPCYNLKAVTFPLRINFLMLGGDTFGQLNKQPFTIPITIIIRGNTCLPWILVEPS